MKKLITVLWIEFYEGGVLVDNYFDLPDSVAEAHKTVSECRRFPFMYQIAQDGLPVVDWTAVDKIEDLPFVAEG